MNFCFIITGFPDLKVILISADISRIKSELWVIGTEQPDSSAITIMDHFILTFILEGLTNQRSHDILLSLRQPRVTISISIVPIDNYITYGLFI